MANQDTNKGLDHGIYLWRDPKRHGYPIGETEISKLISFAKSKRIKRILYDNWGTGRSKQDDGWSIGSGRQPDNFLNSLIFKAHKEGLLIEALYTDNLRFQNVINYNQKNQNKFDGIRMNYEGPWNIGSFSNKKFYEPVSEGDIAYFAEAKKMANVSKIPSVDGMISGLLPNRAISTSFNLLPVYASISWHWGRSDTEIPDKPILFNGKQKPAYQHILDIVSGVDIQTAWGGPNAVDALLFRVRPIIKYARSIGKPAWITIETSDQATANQTFKDKGTAYLESTVQELLSKLASENNSPAGIIYHFYMNSYG